MVVSRSLISSGVRRTMGARRAAACSTDAALKSSDIQRMLGVTSRSPDNRPPILPTE